MPKENRRIAETTFRVRFAETDQMQIVHHAAYIVYLEEGRSELGRQFGASYSAFEDAGFSLAVTEIQAQYLASARYDQRVTVRTWIEDLRSRSLIYAYEILNAETQQILVTGMTKHVCVDREGHIRRIPDAWRNALASKMILDVSL
jgi:acyl-CoA thioester hydrolase